MISQTLELNSQCIDMHNIILEFLHRIPQSKNRENSIDSYQSNRSQCRGSSKITLIELNDGEKFKCLSTLSVMS